MKLVQKCLVIVSVANMAVSPVFAAGSGTPRRFPQADSKQKPSNSEGVLDDVLTSINEDGVSIVDKNTNETIGELPFTHKEKLKKFSPRKLEQILASQANFLKQSHKQALSGTLHELPWESVKFAAIMSGFAVMSANPIALQQELQHSTSFVGTFGFGLFMYSQRLTSNVLQAHLNPFTKGALISVASMLAGAVTQSMFTQIWSDQNVRKCALSMADSFQGGKLDWEACEKSYDYLVIHKKLFEMAPNLLSMVATVLTLNLPKVIAKKAPFIVKGVNVALKLMPGRLQVVGVRILASSAANIAMFTKLNEIYEHYISYAWGNFWQSKDLNNSEKGISGYVQAMKQSKWNSSDQGLQVQLHDFHDKMSAWRILNLREFYDAHKNWSDKLNQLISMYNSSYEFYNNFVSELRTAQMDSSGQSRLKRPYPFYGIKAKGLNTSLLDGESQEDAYLTNPAYLESMQMETITDAAKVGERFMTSNEKLNGKLLKADEKLQLQSILNKFKSDDYDIQSQGIHDFLKTTNNTLHKPSTDAFKKVLGEMFSTLGKPMPIKELGLGYLLNYQMAPITKKTFDKVPFYQKVGSVMTPYFTDYMLMQMLCGPDPEKGQSSIKNIMDGFPAVFLPPTIKNPNDTFKICDEGSSIPLASTVIYRSPWMENSQYKNAVEYLEKQARESVMGENEDFQPNFQSWWKQLDNQMTKAFDTFYGRYQAIVVKLVEGLHGEANSKFNNSDISNGAIKSIFQQEKVYLSLLQELIEPSQGYQINFKSILSDLNNQVRSSELVAIDKQFKNLNNLFRKIFIIIDAKGNKTVRSTLEHSDLLAQLKNIQAALQTAATSLGLKGTENKIALEPPFNSKIIATGAEDKTKRLNPQQQALASTCLDLLETLAIEFYTYGTMSNVVTWSKIQNKKELEKQDKELADKIDSKVQKIKEKNKSN